MTSETTSCCPEFAALSRRGFLTGAAAVVGATTVVGSAVISASAGAALASTGSRAVLVVLSLRGAADGLSLVVPHGDPAYAVARGSIAVPTERLLGRDDMFGLHPSMAPLMPLWTSGRLAAVHATGLPVPNRSHFAAMEEVEDADPGSSARVGWLNRLIGLDGDDSPLQGFNLSGGVPPTSLYGPEPVMAAEDLESARIAGDDKWDTEGRRLASLHRLWDGEQTSMGRAMRAAFGAVEDLAPALATPADAPYPNTDLGRAMREVARLIRGNVGTRVITVDQGDWDHHTGVGTVESGRMKRNTEDLANAVAAFFDDLGPLAEPDQANVTLVTISEFGRRVKVNGSGGLDHGWGNVMLLAGAGVVGQRYYGSWPGLQDDLNADLTVTTDYRSVLAEVAAKRFGASVAQVFPGFSPETVGAMRVG
ncbi:DUF1501 domain-containing protein [Nocardioides sp. GCM10027113]|uniref:DUF1501 domain-containing protein n=1 Tax=unclassified Nocardioides TaxID=2615069 RepID=UPI00360CAF5F